MTRTGRLEARWATVVALLLLAILYMTPRLIGLDRFVTSDEPIWLGRSANFARALASGELEHTFQFAHPGVMTMWAGGLAYLWVAPGYVTTFTDNLIYTPDIHLRLREIGLNELDVLVVARIAKILLQTVLFLVAMTFVRRLFGPWVMLLAGTLIAFDPFLSGIDSVLHVDGLFAIASFAAVLALADACRSDRPWPWLIAGGLAAVAWLTRSTGIVLVPLVGLVLVLPPALHVLGRSAGTTLAGTIDRGVWRGTAWGAAALVATVLLWPALWVAPWDTLRAMWEWARFAAEDGHELPTFFAGTIHQGDAGPWFYPVSIAWRLTPVTVLGLVALVVVVVRRRLPAQWRGPMLLLAAFALLYVLGMSQGAKKFDRYILPVYPVLDLFAAVGLVLAARWALTLRHQRPRPRVVVAITMAVLIVGQALSTVAVLPYRLDHYNPLLGGPVVAERWMQMGWGEGMDGAVPIIEADVAHRGLDRPEVRISGSRAVLLYLLPETYVVYPFDQQPVDLERWMATDYYVAYVQRWQRDLDAGTISWLARFQPIGTVDVEGVEFVRVYRIADIPPPPAIVYEARHGAALAP